MAKQETQELELDGKKETEKRSLKQWDFDFSDPLWETGKPFREWTLAANRGNFDTMTRMAMTVVVSWPYPGDPQTLEAWDALPRQIFKDALAEVSDQIGELFQ